MTKEEVLEFAEKNPVFSLATVDGDQPRVRLMMLPMVDENGLVFATGSDKDVCKQMTATSLSYTGCRPKLVLRAGS